MGPSLYRTTLVVQTQGALEALLTGHSAESAWEPELLALVLERWGDALRLGEGRALQVERRLHGVTPGLLGRVAQDRVTEARAWVLPESDEARADLVDDIAFVATRRDETESLIDAMTRWMRMGDGLVFDVPGVDELLATLEAFDRALARVATREMAEAALGVRVALHGDGSWLSRLAEPVTDATHSADTTGLEELEHLESTPSESATDAYLRHAKLAAYVERAAERDPLYAEELALTIDALLACHEALAWRARSWRRRYKAVPAPDQLRQIALAGPLVLAAASKETAPSEAGGYQALGALPGVAAEADLTIEGEQLVVRAYPAALRGLLVNTLAGQRVSEDDCWAVRLPFQRGMELTVLIVDEVGARFEDTIVVT
jgi:hypothetical protein